MAVTVGGIALQETRAAEVNSTTVAIAGRESYVTSTVAEVLAAHHNVTGLQGATVPVVFDDKTELTGFYRVADASSLLTKYASGAVQHATWSLTLERLGTAADVEFESRLPMIQRTDELAGTQTASFWHAVPVGALDYYTGTTVPASSITRTSSDGAVPVHLGIPAGFPPRWRVPADAYLNGSARLLFDGIRRLGTFTPPLAVWEMSNGLVRVMSGGGAAFTVWCWDSGAWRSAKSYVPAVSGVNLTTVPEFTVLDNEPEEVRVRLSYPLSPGRVQVDLSLRRGARLVVGVIKRHSAATLGIRRTEAEAGTAFTGGLKATAADADDNWYVMLSSRLLGTVETGTGYISKASVTAFDFAVGHVVSSAPPVGDASGDLLNQYLAAGGERVRVVRR